MQMERAGDVPGAAAQLNWAAAFSTRTFRMELRETDRHSSSLTIEDIATRRCPGATLHRAAFQARNGWQPQARELVKQLLAEDDRWVVPLRRIPDLVATLDDPRIAGEVRLAEHRLNALQSPITPGDPWTREGLRAHGFELPN